MTNVYAVSLSDQRKLVVVAGSINSAIEKAQMKIKDYISIVGIHEIENDVIY